MLEAETKILTLTLSDVSEVLNINIKDTGCGIPKENYGKIFTPFFTTKKMGKGTGLGLAISYGIIKMHRGDITFQSETGAGTSFNVTLRKNLRTQNINLN